MSEAPIPARTFPVSARAPGKCILFGEHAVVHGRPEVLLAVDLYSQVILRPSTQHRLNGHPEDVLSNRYLSVLLEPPGTPTVDIRVVSRIPRAAGLGSSAALCVAMAASLAALDDGAERPALAQRSFDVEREAQGVGSPGDTTASVAGGYVALNAGEGERLWEVSDGERSWAVGRLPDPGWVWVLGYTGIPRQTADAVRAFGARVARSDGPNLLDRFEAVARQGLRALLAADREAVGRAMNENHALLVEAGVSHPRLEALANAVAPAALGAKLTGAGAGGSIVALPRPGREVEASRRIAQAGGVPYVVRSAPTGVELVDPIAP